MTAYKAVVWDVGGTLVDFRCSRTKDLSPGVAPVESASHRSDFHRELDSSRRCRSCRCRNALHPFRSATPGAKSSRRYRSFIAQSATRSDSTVALHQALSSCSFQWLQQVFPFLRVYLFPTCLLEP